MMKYSIIFNKGQVFMLCGVIVLTFLLQELNAQDDFSPREREFLSTTDYSSQIEKQIHSGSISTADLIIDSHPRIWMNGYWDWDAYDQEGSFAWRISHNPAMDRSDPADDSQQYEFTIVARGGDSAYGVETSDFKRWYLRLITAAEAMARPEWGFPRDLPSTSKRWNQEHTEDEYLSAALVKILAAADENLRIGYDYLGASGLIKPCVGYDWLAGRKYTDGTPVLSEADREEIQNKIIAVAEDMRSHALGNGHFFNGYDISRYCYFIAGLALYEPSNQGISATNNTKAKQYLDEFDEYWVGKILPVLNEQGGTGGWHAGYAFSSSEYFSTGSINSFIYRIGPVLFAHYTATGQSFENSVFSTGLLKYAIEFQNHMVYPNGEFGIGQDSGHRYQWIAPLTISSRRRFSSDKEQQWLGELAGWFRNEIAPNSYVDEGSYCLMDQLMWEEKWPNPRSADELECGTRHFAKLGWIAMRSGFTSSEDLAALFICQRYHWSEKDLYAQNSFHIMRKGWLIEGNKNTIFIDDQYQRTISSFPTISDGVQAYSPNSEYDVGPGITSFESNNDYDYMVGDATNAYDNSKLEKFTRQFVYLKPDKFIILDQVKTTDANFKKSWVVDPGAIPQSFGDTLMMIDNGTGALWIKRLLPSDIIQSISADRIEVTPTLPVKQDIFLFVLQATNSNQSKDSPVVVADQAELIYEGNKIGVQIDNSKILFDLTDTSEVSAINVKKDNIISPKQFTLLGTYPNPFNNSTIIDYEVTSHAEVTIDIFEVSGRLVVTLVSETQSSGRKKVRWNGIDQNGKIVASGVYFIRLSCNAYATIAKVVLIR